MLIHHLLFKKKKKKYVTGQVSLYGIYTESNVCDTLDWIYISLGLIFIYFLIMLEISFVHKYKLATVNKSWIHFFRKLFFYLFILLNGWIAADSLLNKKHSYVGYIKLVEKITRHKSSQIK